MRGVFREIVEPERLVFTAVAVDKEGNLLLEALTTVTFADHGGKTKLTLQARVVKATAEAAPHLEGMEGAGAKAWNERLEEHLAKA